MLSVFGEYGWEALSYVAYSPDPSPPDYNLFLKLKAPTRGVRFTDLIVLNDAVSQRIRELNSNKLLNNIQSLFERSVLSKAREII